MPVTGLEISFASSLAERDELASECGAGVDCADADSAAAHMTTARIASPVVRWPMPSDARTFMCTRVLTILLLWITVDMDRDRCTRSHLRSSAACPSLGAKRFNRYVTPS